jgi:hypothetical protein
MSVFAYQIFQRISMGRLGKRWNCVSGMWTGVVGCSVEAMALMRGGGAIVDMKSHIDASSAD